MMRCGNCREEHGSVAEVRSCYGLGEHRPAAPATGDGATAKQIDLIRSLLDEREVPATTRHQLAERLPAMSKRGASVAIDELFSFPRQVAARVAPVAQTAPTTQVPLGTYTVVLDDELTDWVTLKLDTAGWADNKTVISFLSGATNTHSYKGFAFLDTDGVRVWNRFREDTRLVAATQVLLTGATDEAHERFLKTAEAYALQSGKCARCGRKLTVPASLHRGLGPECASREGVA